MPSDTKTTKRPLSLSGGKLELKKTVESGQVRQSFSHGRSKVVQVERKRKRQFEMGADGKVQEVKAAPLGLKAKAAELFAKEAIQHGTLTEDEKAHRLKALQDALKADEENRKQAEEDAKVQAEVDALRAEEESLRATLAPKAAEPQEVEPVVEIAPVVVPGVETRTEVIPGPRRDVVDDEDDEDGGSGREEASHGEGAEGKVRQPCRS